jgi:hypothetical protein
LPAIAREYIGSFLALRTPSNDELRRFCLIDDWIDLTGRPGHKGSDHDRYAKILPNGERLYTRVSRNAGGVDDHGLFKHILRDQLRVTEEQFWEAVDGGTPPKRPGQEKPTPPPATYLDYSLVRQLMHAGYTHEDISGFSRQGAIDRLDHWRTRGRRLEEGE